MKQKVEVEGKGCQYVFRQKNEFGGPWCSRKLGIDEKDQRCTADYPGCPYLHAGNIVNFPKVQAAGSPPKQGLRTKFVNLANTMRRRLRRNGS